MSRRAVRSFQVGIFMLAAGLAQAGAANAANTAELISQPVRICGTGAGYSMGWPRSLSADGRYIAFTSYAPNLVVGQQISYFESLFLRDRVSGETVLVSHKAGEPLTGRPASDPVVSADGSFVIFRSGASDLVAGQVDSGPMIQLFLWERATGTISLISRSTASASTEANGQSYGGFLSTDGRYFAFGSEATDLVPGQVDSNSDGDVFLYDRVAGSLSLVSHSTASPLTTGNDHSSVEGMSADGRYLLLQSGATDLVPGKSGILLYDRVAGALSYVAVGQSPRISADGSFIAFASDAELVPGQTDPSGYGYDVYLYERGTGTLTLVTHASSSALTSAQGTSELPVLSQDGRYVVYVAESNNLVAGQPPPVSREVFVYDRVSGENRFVSHAASSTVVPANGASDSPILSADGRWIAFLSGASDLVAGQSGPLQGASNVFLYDRTTQAVTLVSHAAGSVQTASERSSETLTLSPDGRWLAFESDSESLSDEDCNARSDVFLYDRDGALQIVSRHHPDMPSLTGSWVSLLAYHSYPISALSDDGRFIAFVSGATNLVEGVTGYTGAANVFLRDRQTGETVLVSASAAVPGRSANHNSQDLALSADGRWLAFLSKASDLVPGQIDANGSNDVFLFDRISRNVVLVSRSAASAVTTGSSPSLSLGISSDGRYVVFSSFASDLVPGQVDAFFTEDVFVYDRLTGQTGLVSRKAGTLVEAAGSSSEPQISGDGRYVAFMSSAQTLVAGASHPFTYQNIYLQDRWAGITTLVSRSNGPTLTAVGGSSPSLSLDGRFVSYESAAWDIVPGQSDTNNTWDVFVYDRGLDANSLLSHVPGSPLTTGNDFSAYSRISPEGTYVAFESWATDLVPGQTDTNADRDVFLHDSRSGENTLVSHAAGSPATTGAGYSRRAPAAADGKVVFLSRAPDLVAGQVDDTTSLDVFLYDPASGENRLLSGAGGSETVAGSSAFMVAISRNGRSVAFDSGADNLVEGDYNGGSDVFAVRLADVATDFYAIEPCRLLDTRTPEDGPALVSGRGELLAVHGVCGIPATARALALNVTAIGATSSGNLRLHEGGVAAPGSSTINFTAGLTRANNAIVALTPDVWRGLTVTPFVSDGGTVHVLIDVTGYFE